MTVTGPAFITGGSSGIGLALAACLADRGHPLALFARDPGKLDAARQRLAPTGVQISTHSVDVGDPDAMGAALGQALAIHGAPTWAIANAGIAQPGLFLDQPLAQFEAQMRTNYMGALYFAKALAPQMTGGHLVFVSSGAAFFGIHGYSAYAPSKFALRGLAEVLRVELAPRISVTLAYPPDTDTPQLAAEGETKPAATKEITASGGVWQPDAVARHILKRAEAGKFTAAPGLQMQALLVLHSLLGPALRRWQSGIVKRHG